MPGPKTLLIYAVIAIVATAIVWRVESLRKTVYGA